MAIMTVNRPGTGEFDGPIQHASILPAGTTEPAARRWRTPLAALALAVLALLVAQEFSGTGYDSMRDPLSGLEWTDQGWLFPIALLILAVGLFGAAAGVGAVRRWGTAPAVLLALAGAGGALAAFYPSDRSDALVMTGVGEVHRWASTAVLILPLVTTLLVVRRMRAAANVDRALAAVRTRLVAMLTGTAFAGAVFLGGFLPTVLHTRSGFFDDLIAVNGLSQRVLALSMMVCVWQLVAESRQGRVNHSVPTPMTSTV